MSWKPRASSLGYFISCDARAAFTRAIDEGKLDPNTVAENTESPYAAFGTCVHFVLQDGTGCIFPKKSRPTVKDIRESMVHYSGDPIATRAALAAGSSRAYMYTPDELRIASGMCDGDVPATLAKIREVATFAATHLPKSPDGKPWLAEANVGSKDGSGHVDFMSQCGTWGGDLKTTTRPPEGDRMKAAHMGQLASYALDSGVLKWWVLYIGTGDSRWALRVDMDFTTDAGAEYLQSVSKYRKYLRSAALYDRAMPRIGKHCSDDFCPFKKACKDRFLPPAGVQIVPKTKPKLTGAITL